MCVICTFNTGIFQNALLVLGIPFADIMRVLAAVLLLGNVKFVEGTGLELEVEGNIGRLFF